MSTISTKVMVRETKSRELHPIPIINRNIFRGLINSLISNYLSLKLGDALLLILLLGRRLSSNSLSYSTSIYE